MSAGYWLLWALLTVANAALLYGHYRMYLRIDALFEKYKRSIRRAP